MVSSSSEDLFFSYLPEFRAKTESSVNPLPRSFCVRSLKDFVGDLAEELLLCPVLALCKYITRTLFVFPHSPFRSLSKNALSFFIHDLIPQASCSSGSSVLFQPSTSVGSPRSSSSLRADDVRGVAASGVFA